jgi:cobalt-precorrin-7 (C5)-methyltransferase
MAGKLFVVGVGPGSSEYLTDIAKHKIIKSRYIVGYSYTLLIIRHLLDPTWQRISEVTMNSQDDIYKNIFDQMESNECCTVPFTGDVNFSESEVVDRLIEADGIVEL